MEQVQTDAIKFERTQIHCFMYVYYYYFFAFVVA